MSEASPLRFSADSYCRNALIDAATALVRGASLMLTSRKPAGTGYGFISTDLLVFERQIVWRVPVFLCLSFGRDRYDG